MEKCFKIVIEDNGAAAKFASDQKTITDCSVDCRASKTGLGTNLIDAVRELIAHLLSWAISLPGKVRIVQGQVGTSADN
jgi:hypothetical protein